MCLLDRWYLAHQILNLEWRQPAGAIKISIKDCPRLTGIGFIGCLNFEELAWGASTFNILQAMFLCKANGTVTHIGYFHAGYHRSFSPKITLQLHIVLFFILLVSLQLHIVLFFILFLNFLGRILLCCKELSSFCSLILSVYLSSSLSITLIESHID